jgi:hypothetical protein
MLIPVMSYPQKMWITEASIVKKSNLMGLFAKKMIVGAIPGGCPHPIG